MPRNMHVVRALFWYGTYQFPHIFQHYFTGSVKILQFPQYYDYPSAY